MVPLDLASHTHEPSSPNSRLRTQDKQLTRIRDSIGSLHWTNITKHSKINGIKKHMRLRWIYWSITIVGTKRASWVYGYHQASYRRSLFIGLSIKPMNNDRLLLVIP